MKEQIILQADVEYLGLAGEKIEVARGYARNYLFPKKLAVPVTKANEKRLAVAMTTVVERKQRQQERAQLRAAELESLTLKVAAKVGEGGRLFGSVTSMDVARALAEQGHEIDRRKIEVKSPFKKVGLYQVPVRLELQVTATLTLRVVDEANPDAPFEEEAPAEPEAPSLDEAPVETGPDEAETEEPEPASQ